MPGKADLLIYEGDDYSATVTVTNATTTPPDLTGFIAHAQIRNGPADSNTQVIVEVTATVSTNIVTLSIPAAQTVLLSKPLYAWDLQLHAPTGETTTILAGRVIVTAEVTREP
jgi:hypothetical protein